MTLLTGQVALVTGGASGIGRAITELYLREGASVAFTYLTSDEAAREIAQRHGDHTLAIRADVSRGPDVQRAVQETAERFGRLDILVANAGGLIQRSPIADCPEELWDRALEINLKSTFLCCKAVIPLMTRQGGGRIVTLTSLAAHDGGGAGSAHYATAKGGVLTFTRALAKEVGPHNIRVNAIAPGLIATQFHDRFTRPEVRQAVVARTPLGREGTAEDVAKAALFLASDLSSFVTGETVEVNGGQAMS